MSTLLMTGILFAFAGLGALCMHKRFEEQLPLAAGLVVVVLYVFALMGKVLWGAYIVLVLALLALIGQLICLIRRRAIKWILTPGCAVFFLIAAWLLFSFRGYMFTEWDDFSHWGVAVKNLSIFHTLPAGTPEATTTYNDYPPATTLFSWFWTHLSGTFNEEDAQRAVNMLMLCFLLPAMKDQEWKRPGKALCMSAVLFVLPLLFAGNAYRTLQVDVLMGCMLLYILCEWFLGGKNLPGMGCTLFLLPLVKEMGAAFAVLALVIIAADLLFFSGKGRVSSLKIAGVLAIAVAAASLSWGGYLKLHRVDEVWNKGGIFVSLSSGLRPDHFTIMGRFLEKISSPEIWSGSEHLSCIMWIVLILTSCHLLNAYDGQEKKRFLLLFRLLMAGFALYLLVLLLIYLFLFRSDEAMNMNSLERYLSSYMLPLAGFVVLWLNHSLDGKALKGKLNAPLCLITALLVLVNPLWIVRETATSGTRIAAVYETRMANTVSHDALEAVNPDEDRVYVVAAGDAGWRYYECAYQFTPVPVQEGMWSAWPVAHKSLAWEDKTSVEYSPEAWGEMLVEGGFTYVYLDHIDERLINDYHMLFEDPSQIRNGGMYRVENGAEGVRFCAI